AATPGDLDASFAGTGFVTQSQGDTATGNAVISDYKNRVVTAYSYTSNAPGPTHNEFAVMRHLDTGAIDFSFGVGGIANLPLPAKDLWCVPELVEDTGYNLLVASCNADTIFVWRLKPSGALDTSYGSGGIASILVGNGVYPVIGLTQYKNRALIAASSVRPGGTRPRFTLVRLNAAGALDTSLAGTGIARYDVMPGVSTEVSRATDVKIDSAFRIVLGGRAGTSSLNYNFALARLSWSGTLDASFAAGGVTQFPLMTGPNFGRRVAFDHKDRILLSGTVCKPADPVTGEQPCYVGLARLLTSGALDTSLVGGTGTMVYGGGGGPANPKAGFCTDFSFNYALTTYKDRIHLAGMCDLDKFSTTPSYPRNTVGYVLRLDADGQYDTSFGYTLNGYSYYDFGAPEAYLLGIAIDKNAQILATGRRGKTVSDTEAYGEVVTARMVQ
ncbi:MAG: hypothetical protein JNN20_17515, partial [Betaproteobacteria bacterium]|nr:hypothetical protein [Betaproteobacteria bacterium]